jgi:KDO transferase-3
MTFNPQRNTWDIFWKNQLKGSTIPLPAKNSDNSNIWILATGPSLSDLDLELLKDKTIMGVNGAIATCSPLGLKPKYYAVTDRDFFENRMHLVEAAVNSGAHCFFSFNGIAKIAELAPHLLAEGKISLLETANRYYEIPQLPPNDWVDICRDDHSLHTTENSKVGWSSEINKGVFTANTITYIGCQVAAFLGARNVFIAGMDLGAGSIQDARCYEKGESARPSTINRDYEKEILPAFQLLSELEMSTKFWNLSAISRLPNSVMKKITFGDSLHIS